MSQLTYGSLLKFKDELLQQGMTEEQVLKLPIYIGDDDELNGIHCAWYTDIIAKNHPDYEYFKDMINGRSANIELTNEAILIS